MLKNDRKTIRAWTFYDWANSVYSLTITSAIFPLFYAGITQETGTGSDLVLAKSGGVPAQSLYSYALSAGFLLIALIAPLLSGIADRMGNKRAYLQAFCYVGATACAGLAFFTLEGLWWGLALVAIACVGFSGSLVFYDAFLVDIADADQHDRVSARGYTMGYIGSVLLLVLNLLMVQNPDWFPATITFMGTEYGAIAARATFITVALWWVGFAQIAFRRLPARTQVSAMHGGAIWSGYAELRKVWGELRRTVRLKKFLLAFFVYNMGIQTVMYLAVTFAQKEIKQVDETGAIVAIADESLIISILLIQLVAAVGAMVFVRLSKRFSNVRALLIGVSVWVAICVGAYFTHWTNEFYLLASCVGLVMGGCQALSRSTYSKFLPPTKDTASYFSFYDVSYYLGTVLGTVAYGLVYQVTGDLRDTVIAIASFFVIGLVLLMRVPKDEVVLAQ